MTRAKTEIDIARQLVRRARVDLVLGQSADDAARSRLIATLDEISVASMATPLEEAAAILRSALPDDSAALEADTVAMIVAALDELEALLGVDAPQAPPEPEPARAKGAALRDAETVEIYVDFIAESADNLERVDEILLAADQGSADAEQINALFRVFHTIKGVAGFLGAEDVTRVAHATETLLDDVRAGRLELSGGVLEAVFESSTAMRGLLAGVREALVKDRALPTSSSTEVLVARIERVTATRVELPASSVLKSEPPLDSTPAPKGSLRPLRAAPTPAPAPPPDSARPAQANEATANGTRIRQTVKVDLERIDSVVEMIGELIIVETMVANAPELVGLASLRIRNYLGQLTKISRDLQNVAMRMRMVPVRGVFQKMARLARELARKTGKNVVLEQIGDTTEMDRSMVERIEDPLIHMIRNAIDHAIEPVGEREHTGKPDHGTIRLAARHESGSVVIEISDDGRGLRREAILNKAKQRGLVDDKSDLLTDSEVFELIFLPGFSTAEKVSELSGRGVGMDVVKRGVESMRGRIAVHSTPGQGTTFKLILPLTLAIIDGMLVSCAGERYIIPSLAIVESLQPQPGMVRTLGTDGELINVRGEIMPLLRLSRLFGTSGAESETEIGRVVVIESAGRKLGLLVDDVLTQQQIVIKPLGPGLGSTELLAGAAILPDGRVGLIVNIDRLSGLFAPRRVAFDASDSAA